MHSIKYGIKRGIARPSYSAHQLESKRDEQHQEEN